ncbi:hypothetical protein [Hazenella coriacea]|uniref:Uncharacterized protein n=1 Tax=Hazenella coriacea TaxID=1179467 RepID=A0A4R3L9G2_9BACL|nr:hypothetical protein [Hazenella coriacea]TCS94864.1 hypothetical protein EDD58_103287 [Hazenella coriacea]
MKETLIRWKYPIILGSIGLALILALGTIFIVVAIYIFGDSGDSFEGDWVFSIGPENECPTALNFHDDETLTITLNGRRGLIQDTGSLQKTGDNTYIFNTRTVSLPIELKKLKSDLLYMQFGYDCEFTKSE